LEGLNFDLYSLIKTHYSGGAHHFHYCRYGQTLNFRRRKNHLMKEKEIIRSGEGKNFNYSQDHCFVKLSSKSTNGELCLVEDTLKPGFYLGRHHHKIMTEVFYVLEGEIELIFDDTSITAETGDTVTVPPNVWHAASCEKGGKMLTIFKNGHGVFLGNLKLLTRYGPDQGGQGNQRNSKAERQ
jgi:quercetin dioxygenase-like cupin family protein